MSKFHAPASAPSIIRSAFAEYKANDSFVDVDIDRGAMLKTDVFTHGINLGTSLHF